MSRWWPGVLGLALLVLGPGGCATASDPTVRPMTGAPPAIASTPSGTDIRYRTDVITAETALKADPARVWEALGRVYAELELPVAAADAGQRALQTGRFRAARTIGGKPLATFLDCGSTITGRRTENSDVYLEMTSSVRAAAPGTARVATTLVASARNRDGTSTAAVPCATTGGLEKLVAARVLERVGG